MLCDNARVRILRSGATVRVQDLEPGELVFNPLAGCFHAIENIRTREITAEEVETGEFDHLLPVFLPEGCLGDGKPSRGVRVSPAQSFFVCKELPRPPGRRKYIFEVSAAQLLAEGSATRAEFPKHGRLTYHFLEFSDAACIEVNGAALRGGVPL